MRTKGGPPKTLTGRTRVSGESPWWREVCLRIGEAHAGEELSIEKLYHLVPDYPDGRHPRRRAIARRLAPILELLSRGPNGSRSTGALYRITRLPPPPVRVEPIGPDEEWLRLCADAMVGEQDEEAND